MNKYKIIIVDEHEIFRMGLKLFINMLDNATTIGEFSKEEEFLEFLKKNKPDIVFLDIDMPILYGIDIIEKILKLFPKLKIIVLTNVYENKYFERMICSGIQGYILKNSKFNDYRNAIEKVMRGGYYFSEELLVNYTRASISVNINDRMKSATFSKRELEVLQLICKGYSNKEIGKKLFISPRTIERHKSKLFEKSNTSNVVNLILYAIKQKFVDL